MARTKPLHPKILPFGFSSCPGSRRIQLDLPLVLTSASSSRNRSLLQSVKVSVKAHANSRKFWRFDLNTL